MTLSLGRLLSGQKRCPRIGVSPRLTEAGRAWHGEGLFSSEGGRRYLAAQFGVTRYHLDDLPWGEGESVPREKEAGEARFYIHSPWAVVTVTDACPWIGGKSSAEVATCPRSCREGKVALRESSMGEDMVQRGKARFVDPGGNSLAPAPPRDIWGRIRYGFPP